MQKITDLFINVIVPVGAGVAIYLLPIQQEIKNYLPDALWAYAFISTLFIIWDRKLPIIWFSGILAVFIGFEILQKINIIKGTGDITDVIVYILSAIIAILTNPFFRKNKNA